jgi:hypothetical protein
MRMSIWILPCALAACAVELPPDPDPGSADTTAGAPTLPPLHARTPQVARELERARVHALHAEERLRARRAELARLHALLAERGYPTEVHAALDELFARDLAGREVARFADGSPVIERVGCDEVAAVPRRRGPDHAARLRADLLVLAGRPARPGPSRERGLVPLRHPRRPRRPGRPRRRRRDPGHPRREGDAMNRRALWVVGLVAALAPHAWAEPPIKSYVDPPQGARCSYNHFPEVIYTGDHSYATIYTRQVHEKIDCIGRTDACEDGSDQCRCHDERGGPTPTSPARPWGRSRPCSRSRRARR